MEAGSKPNHRVSSGEKCRTGNGSEANTLLTVFERETLKDEKEREVRTALRYYEVGLDSTRQRKNIRVKTDRSNYDHW